MPYCAPQRYLANDRNALRGATLTPSSVLAIADQVLETPVARVGSGAVVLEGSYTGAAPATYDVEILDNIVDAAVVTKPVATGQGSGTLENITAAGVAQQFVVELQTEGVPQLRAGIDFEGVRIVARVAGTGGNAYALDIDRSGLVFTPQAFSLLGDLAAGIGGPDNGALGAAFDWDTKVLGVDNIIPADAHRVSFGADTSNIYLQYKKFTDGEWRYHFVPAIKLAVPAGTIVNFVTGSRTVYVTDGSSPPLESFAGIITVYDLLDAIKRESALLDVSGIVAYDRTPTGQASREILLRTDAHCELSTGTGSKYATGFADCFANDNAATELVTAECFAVTSKDNPQARVGMELWHLKGSVSGELGDIVTGVPFTDPGGKFGLTVPVKLPNNYTQPTGRFTHIATNYVGRDEEKKPPICVVAMTLGPEAVDETVTLVWTQRPNGDCACKDLPVPKLSKRCLGIETEGDDLVGLQADTLGKLLDLWDYARTVALVNSVLATGISGIGAGATEAPSLVPFIENPAGVSATLTVNAGTLEGQYVVTHPPGFIQVVSDFEALLLTLDPIDDATGLRTAGETAWDTAFAELQTIVPSGSPSTVYGIDPNVISTRLNWVRASAGIPSQGGADASIVESGDGCWRDMGGDFWTVVGSDKGAYAPAFTGTPYYASRLATDGKKYFSTKEFGFQINIKCPELLEYGDTIVLAIGDAGRPATYQIGDILIVPIVAGQNLQLAGGQNGNGVLTWYVTGSVDGALAPFVYDPNTPVPYVATGVLQFEYVPGGIPNRKGDKFTFSIEGGHYRWRKDGGSWQTGTDQLIAAVAAPFDAGLTIRFEPGASPSFVTADTFTFRALQPWAVDNVKYPGPERWKWSGATPTLGVDIGSIVPIEALMISRHTIPQGATVTLNGGNAAANEWSEPVTWRNGVMYVEFTTPRTARYLELALTGATNGSIGWAWAGEPLTTELSADVQIRPSYRVQAGTQSLDQGNRYLARGHSGSVKFSEIALKDADVDGLNAMIDHVKQNDDEAIVIVPNVTRPGEAYLTQIGVDEFDFEEITGNNAQGARERRYSIDLPLTGVWGV